MVVADSSLWIDYLRAKTSKHLKGVIEQVLADADTALVEPVIFETLRAAPQPQRSRISAIFETYPVLTTAPSLWTNAVRLGQSCADRGFQVPAMDILIAQSCLHHDAQLVTFDRHYEQIAQVAPLKLLLLAREA